MARIRTVKPEFWTDGRVLDCSRDARLLFIGMWNFADDYGNVERSARQLKLRVMPEDNVNAEDLITELMHAGLIYEYEAEGQKYLHIKGFQKHQRINRPSEPAHPLPDDSVSQQQQLTDGSCRKGREGKGRECSLQRFDEFWEVWPKKKAKPDAQKAWKQMGCDSFADDLIAHVRDRKARDPEWLKDAGKFIPHAGTFLRGKRWEDEWEVSAEARQSEEVIH